MSKKEPPKTIEQDRIILASSETPCKLNCDNNWSIRKTVEQDLNVLKCALEDLDQIKSSTTYLMRQDRPGQLWSYDWKEESTFEEKREEELETIRGFVQAFYNEQSLNCTCPENYKDIRILKEKYGDEIPTFTQYGKFLNPTEPPKTVFIITKVTVKKLGELSN